MPNGVTAQVSCVWGYRKQYESERENIPLLIGLIKLSKRLN
ncbi:Hypoticical protein [Pectobacterium parmentieri]|uniref:Hypoticical protein n=1 Tax=Pectobacterium parmentieri TaxID=1905730 RepID=A0A0H3I557_PECPM|nr:Hypoticical protein [Pectobacterium parmentieri]